ncbi:helix-turn-helix domain-containing GNAT family N-acetyltransferase [Edaphobacter flagellatus]|uniref:helix-turn-helix domain-containing GNAT family N-acetyltransferase n=1 Tax=Edaphobacter flagellatus TaxID=1933044 RepID=UPI0021B185FC|nr:helix-turn-helix domain-containing GNAT family N-acetyltransferase [Edaphobacter flagellatus]
MTSGSGLAGVDNAVLAVREFNRFYTARLGLLRRQHLDGEFSLTEARLLYEIGAGERVTASALRAQLGLDAGYISRLLAALTKQGLVAQAVSERDGRERLLTLTAVGEGKVAELNARSSEEIRGMLEPLRVEERAALLGSLNKVRSLLNTDGARDKRTAVRVVRLEALTEDALELLVEYYEAVQVVVRDGPEEMAKMLADDAAGMWLAYLGERPVGCVVLRRLESVVRAGECKRLYVRPKARGLGIADALMDAEEAYARSKGLEWVYLDSHDGLKAAIALYRRRGYVDCERYNENPQATVFLRKRVG